MARTPQAGGRSWSEVGDAADTTDYTMTGGNVDGLVLMSAAHAFGAATAALGTLPIGAVVVQAWIEVLTAYNAGSTNVLTLGYTGSTSAYLGTADVTEATPAVYPTGGKGPFAAEAASRALVVAYTQTGTPATTGASRAYALVRLP